MQLDPLDKWIWGLGAAIVSAVFQVPLLVSLSALLALMFLDTVGAMIAHGKAGDLDPRVGYLGWRRKASTVLMVLAVAFLEAQVRYTGIDLGIPAAAAVASAFSLIELSSVIRNGIACGVNVPANLAGAYTDKTKTDSQTR